MLLFGMIGARHSRCTPASFSVMMPAPSRLAANSHGIISFADPHPLNHVLSYRYKKGGGEGWVPVTYSLSLSPVLRMLFQVPYPASPLFAALTKTPGGVGVFFPFWNGQHSVGDRGKSWPRQLAATKTCEKAGSLGGGRRGELGKVHSVMMRSAHSTKLTKTAGFPNLKPHCVTSASVTPRARLQAPQANTGICLAMIFSIVSLSGGHPTGMIAFTVAFRIR
jgi:hypothetical protein